MILYRNSRSAVLRTLLLIILLSLCTGLSGCDGKLETVTISVNEQQFEVEVANSPEERETGLMYRKEMGEREGMLFIFPSEEKRAFWMKNTNIPLTICYLAKDGTIKEMYDMIPHSLDPVRSRYSVAYALEVNKGILEILGIGVGDRIILPADLPEAE